MFDLNLFFAYLQLVDLPRSVPEAARLIEGLYLGASAWLEAHLARVGTVLAGLSVSLSARHVTEPLRRFAASWPFPLRLALFVGVVGLGFGLLIGALSPFVTAGLRAVGTHYLVPAILCAFITIGILAERSGRI